jgi:hypothetical protein
VVGTVVVTVATPVASGVPVVLGVPVASGVPVAGGMVVTSVGELVVGVAVGAGGGDRSATVTVGGFPTRRTPSGRLTVTGS